MKLCNLLHISNDCNYLTRTYRQRLHKINNKKKYLLLMIIKVEKHPENIIQQQQLMILHVWFNIFKYKTNPSIDESNELLFKLNSFMSWTHGVVSKRHSTTIRPSTNCHVSANADGSLFSTFSLLPRKRSAYLIYLSNLILWGYIFLSFQLKSSLLLYWSESE